MSSKYPPLRPQAQGRPCPLCGAPTLGLAPIPPNRWGCAQCHCQLTGRFFALIPIRKVKKCLLGHRLTPTLFPGEPAHSNRVGWVTCPTCQKLAGLVPPGPLRQLGLSLK